MATGLIRCWTELLDYPLFIISVANLGASAPFLQFHDRGGSFGAQSGPQRFGVLLVGEVGHLHRDSQTARQIGCQPNVLGAQGEGEPRLEVLRASPESDAMGRTR